MPAAITVKTPASTRASTPRRRLVAWVVHGPTPLPPAKELGDGPVQLGRTVDGPDDLGLDDPSVSRVHVRLSYEPGLAAHVLTDCGSSNGVYVNGARVSSSRAVGVGDVVRLGESLIVLAGALPATDDGEEPMGMYGDGAAIAALRRTIRRLAPSRLPVLVIGATGTGKELVARALHGQSRRAGAFVAINCAALAPTMVEDALFGHRKGAFTGALADAVGAFAAADGGTLFLDEIGDMPLDAQPKLLRALENGEITPIGASRAATVDVRVVAATHVALAEAIDARRFREDLLARLAGVTLTTPRLAERREDIAALWAHLLPEAVRGRAMSADAVEALLLHDWPRNVRELRQLAERTAVLHGDRESWDLADLDPELGELLARRRGGELAAAVAEPEPADVDDGKGPMAHDVLLALLAECDGRVAEVARRAHRNRKQIYRWMEQYGIARGTGRRR